jgi:hypothetical protein
MHIRLPIHYQCDRTIMSIPICNVDLVASNISTLFNSKFMKCSDII